jgi:hypothetical protein
MKMKYGIILSIATFALIAGPGVLSAHHGNAIYDATKSVEVDGVVVEWQWANPHCLLQFDVKNEKGETVRWTAEVATPPDMLARGWSRKMFKPGDAVHIWMVVAKSGEPVGRIARVTVDGKTYEGMGRVPNEAQTKQ